MISHKSIVLLTSTSLLPMHKREKLVVYILYRKIQKKQRNRAKYNAVSLEKNKK